jgi:hypothetical protein
MRSIGPRGGGSAPSGGAKPNVPVRRASNFRAALAAANAPAKTAMQAAPQRGTSFRNAMAKAQGAAATAATADAQPDEQRALGDYSAQDDGGGGGSGGGGGGGDDGTQRQQSDQDRDQDQQDEDAARQLEALRNHQSREDRDEREQEGEQEEDEQQSDDDATADDAASLDDAGVEDVNDEATVAGDGVTAQFHSHMQGGRLITVGMAPSRFGMLPVVVSGRLAGYQDGPVSFGADPAIDNAMKRSMQLAMDKHTKETMRKACEELVERSRAGDQNAFATIDMVRQNAKRGDARARVSHSFIAEYIRTHPVGGAANIAGEPNMRAAVALANGPPLTKDAIQGYLATFGYAAQPHKAKRRHKALATGISTFGNECDPMILRKLDAVERSLLELGRTVGMALRIQRARDPQSQVAPYFSGAAWELGE